MLSASINEALRDDELRAILGKLQSDKDKEVFGLVCKRWLHLQSSDRKKLCARAGPHMLRKMAARFSRLLELDLSQSLSRSFYPGVTDSDLSVIATGFKALRVLNLQHCKGITDNGMVAIGCGLPHLQSLDVSHCRKLTDKGLSAVARGCHDLRRFHLANCRTATDGVLEALSSNCHNLEDLGLEGCVKITDGGLGTLVDGCNRITALDVNKCSSIGDSGISNVSRACSASLKTLKLLDCFKLGDESLISLADFCKNLETLIVGGCRDISGDALASLAAACSHSLKNLRMDWCLNVSDSSVNCILSQCRKLEILDIACCEEVSDAAFRYLDDGRSQLGLKILKASNCPKITVAGISMLVNSCIGLQYLDVRSCPNVTKALCDEFGLQFPVSCKVNFVGSLLEQGCTVGIPSESLCKTICFIEPIWDKLVTQLVAHVRWGRFQQSALYKSRKSSSQLNNDTAYSQPFWGIKTCTKPEVVSDAFKIQNPSTGAKGTMHLITFMHVEGEVTL